MYQMLTAINRINIPNAKSSQLDKCTKCLQQSTGLTYQMPKAVNWTNVPIAYSNQPDKMYQLLIAIK